MLSRVADSIFWMSRYIERADNVARFIDVNLHLSLDLGPSLGHQWLPLVYTTGDQEDFKKRYDNADQAQVIQFLAFDEQNPNSILSCLRSARENARTVREMISSQMWEELNKCYLSLLSAKSSTDVLFSPFEFFNQLKRSAYLIEGVTISTMSHGEAWHFSRLGKLLERADKTSRILDVKYFLLLPSPRDVGTPLDTTQWGALLKSASALEMYRKKHGRITPTRVAEFLILDRDFPRTMHFCLLRAEQSLLAITGGSPGTFRNRAEQLLGRLRAELDYAHVDDIIETGMHEFIDKFQHHLNDVGACIHDTFFAAQPTCSRTHAPPSSRPDEQQQRQTSAS